MTAGPENAEALADELSGHEHAGHDHAEHDHADGADHAGHDHGDGATPAERVEGMPTKEQILEALKNVHDPELGINIVDLGLVYGVDIDEDAGTVHITYTLTTMGCPIGPLIEAQMQQMLAGFTGIRDTSAEMVLRPPWTPEMMSEEAKAALGYF